MLKPENRLKKVRDFNLVMKHGRWAGASFLTAKYIKLTEVQEYFPKKEDKDIFKDQLRVAFTVGLKVNKSAVKRNRLRRQMREVVRLLIKDKKIKSGYYIMIVAKKDALEKDYEQIEKEIKLLLKKMKVL
jgi:ribonuclease P protein component